jgi:hypothetical protein
VLVERWRHEYNTFRPHSALGYRPPAPEAIEPKTAMGVSMSSSRVGRTSCRLRGFPARLRSWRAASLRSQGTPRLRREPGPYAPVVGRRAPLPR